VHGNIFIGEGADPTPSAIRAWAIARKSAKQHNCLRSCLSDGESFNAYKKYKSGNKEQFLIFSTQ